MVAGDCSEDTARCIWEALPNDYRAGAQHVACGKDDGVTSHVERF